jgi:glycosyltransferase involved in cell wall biosynthesis
MSAKFAKARIETRKILVVTQNLPPVICGVGDYAMLFSKELLRQKPDLKISFLIRRKEFSNVRRPVNTQESLLSDTFEIYQVAPYHWNLLALPGLFDTVRKSQAQLVHIHYVPQQYYRAGVGISLSIFALLLRLIGLKVVVTFHECYTEWKPNPKQILIALCQRFSFFLMLLAARELIVSTNLRRTLLRRWLCWYPAKARRVIVAPVGSNFPGPLEPPFDREYLQRKWQLPAGGPVLACLGGVRWKEQFNWLRAALEVVQQKYPQAYLLLIGCPFEEVATNQALANRPDVICTGYCNSGEISELLKCVDLYLLPLEDGVTTRRGTLMAGLHYGLPIISTIGFNTESEFANQLPALLCNVKDRQQFARLAAELAIAPIRRLELGERAARYYQEHFSWEKIVQKQIHLFS